MELHFDLRKEKGFPVDVYVEYNVESGVRELIPIMDVAKYIGTEYEVLLTYIRDIKTYNYNGFTCVTLNELSSLLLNFRENICNSEDYENSDKVQDLTNKFLFIYNNLIKYLNKDYVESIKLGGKIKWQ